MARIPADRRFVSWSAMCVRLNRHGAVSPSVNPDAARTFAGCPFANLLWYLIGFDRQSDSDCPAALAAIWAIHDPPTELAQYRDVKD